MRELYLPSALGISDLRWFHGTRYQVACWDGLQPCHLALDVKTSRDCESARALTKLNQSSFPVCWTFPVGHGGVNRKGGWGD